MWTKFQVLLWDRHKKLVIMTLAEKLLLILYVVQNKQTEYFTHIHVRDMFTSPLHLRLLSLSQTTYVMCNNALGMIRLNHHFITTFK